MSKKLDDLYEKKESLHKGLFSRAKDAMAAHFKRMDDATPTLGRSPEPSKTPNLGQLPDNKYSWKKGLIGAALGDAIAGPLGGIAGSMIAQKFGKKK